MSWRGPLLLLVLLLWLGLGAGLPVLAQESYWQLDVKGGIGPGTSDFIVTELNQAQVDKPAFVLLTMDTPGGLYSATRDINTAILESRIPVVVYVSPGGARAASAGTYILYASHVAAMAPGTHLGAATPVQIGGPTLPGTPTEKDQSKEKEADKQEISRPEGSAMERKTMNDAIAYIRSLAQLRERNADWAELAVRDAATLTATEALEQNVIELIADDIPALLQSLDGRELLVHGSPYTFASTGLQGELREPDWRQRFIITISNPNIAYLLMLVGMYGLLLEFYSPGFGVAGVTGAICLMLALLALQMLPFSTAGLALLGLGLALMVAEGLSPSFGILGGGGLVAFVIGSVLLFDTPDQAFRVAWPFIAAFALFSLSLFIVVIRLIVKQRRSAPVSGSIAMVGEQGIALTAIAPTGTVMVQGERWQACSQHPIDARQPVVVLAVEDLTLNVAPAKETQA
ncbi:membrane-bound serine protease (ClpP class) [Oceanisphaera litoralis]|uniref:NfeD family protein n=1 Tax=Oceanisphaera litoralis TaxID=225144 RepID=UPI0019578C59|nr:nodulation protein NfeD [Oceanisphaera litoralis]MBM7457075.1 membrane-bound serine protease (ClpP class) [Oceanisphaera litoralis]